MGYIEAIQPFQVRGWAFDADRRSERCAIELRVHGIPRASGTADLPRDDLAREGIGDGGHGFVINIDDGLSDAELGELEAIAYAASGENWALPLLRAPAAAEAPARLRLEGFAAVNLEHRPVFVLGAARSGTSAIAQALLKCGAYEGYEEGHALPLIARLLQTVRVYYEENGEDADGSRSTQLADISVEFVLASIRSLFLDIAERMYPSRRWLDKTPTIGAIKVAPLLGELWPNARFIFAKRRGVENIISRTRKFSSLHFGEHCADWAGVMAAWAQVRDRLAGASLEIDQLDIAVRPGEIAAELAARLDLTAEQAQRALASLTFDYPERTGKMLLSYGSADDVDWTAEQRRIFVETCGAMMAAYGYRMPAW